MFYNQYYDANPSRVAAIEFDVWSSEQIRKMSVAEINTFVTFDRLGYPIASGLHDARLGPLKQHGDPCHTCGEFQMKCAGHFGHIELPLPVFNPMFTAIVANFLKISCSDCFRLVIPEHVKIVLTTQLKLVNLGCMVEARELDTYLQLDEAKSTQQIRDEMEQLYEKLAQSRGNATPCKNTDYLWRHYLGRVFRRGALKTCPHCKKPHTKITFLNGRFYKSCRKLHMARTVLVPSEVQKLLRKIWLFEKDLLGTLIKPLNGSKEVNPTDMCFTTAVPVTPSNTRPVQMIRGRPVEHPKNLMYRQILQDSMQVRDIMKVMAEEAKSKKDDDEDGSDWQPGPELTAEPVSEETKTLVAMYKGHTLNEKLHIAWQALQVSVNAMVDSNALRGFVNLSIGATRIGVKQLIEKKAGLMRKNMMGKRADFYARSVITPDPLISINEIGVPMAFAKKLTFPVPVTPWNVSELRKFVLNGPGKYPGANLVESDDGSLVWISESNEDTRRALAKTLLTPNVDSRGPKVVHRHLQEGDMLLMNRQPTLHRPSVMAHKARILEKGKTFRLHYANCKAYNADFDGDEMNAHFPQNEVARAEASEIMNACHQYLVPRDGTPLSGLIQDHVISAFRMTMRGRFYDRLQYHQLVFQALGAFVDDIRLLPPTILKPERLWSGKQVISTIVVNLTPHGYKPLNLFSKSKLGFNAWPTAGAPCDYMSDAERKFMSETNVVLLQGQLLCGVLDKNHVGATHFGLVHSFYELYGGQHSANLLSALSRVLNAYLQENAFSLGVKDIVVKRKPDRQRHRMAKRLKEAGIQAARNALGMAEDEEIDEETLERRLEVAYKKNTNFRALLDHEYKMVLDPVTNEINKVCLPEGLVEPFPDNNLQLMVQSGAKGSTVNTMQISCLLGQIELEGKRPKLMISGKSLPCYRPYDTSPIAGGFIVSRFMSGLRPQEFFFHCMAGREGLIDTAVKTSRSGYLQRCLIKHLEGLVVNYDLTVRDSDNSVIQWRYGEDGLDIPKSQLLKSGQMPFFADNIDTLYSEENFAPLKEGTAKQELRAQKRNVDAWLSAAEYEDVKLHRRSGFLQFCEEMASEPISSEREEEEMTVPGRSSNTVALCNLWYSLHPETREKYGKKIPKVPDPVISNFAPDVHFGSVSENIEKMLKNYFEEVRGNLPVKKNKFKDAVYWKSFKSLCQPGEAVGVLAAQSVGEPSTQMTLNTFHFAGRGEMNVTLGIPRLREILMVASRKIKTPCTEIPFRTDVPRLEKRAEKLRRSITRIVLKDVLEKITVKEMFVPKKRIYKYQLRLYYLPRKSYSSNTNIKPKHIIQCVETRFCWKMEQMLKKHLTKVYSSEPRVKSRGADKNGAEDDEDDNFDEYLGDNAAGGTKNQDENSDGEGDGDATDAKSKRHQNDGEEYDDDEDEEDDDDPEFEVTTNYAADNEKEGDDEDADADETIDTVTAESTPVPMRSTPKDSIVPNNYGVRNIKHDEESHSWTSVELWASTVYKRLDLSSLLPKEVENVVVHEVAGIKRAITYVNNDGLLTLKTEGSYGVSELFKHDRLLNLNKLYSNDVHAVAANYGIEAANRVLIREIQDVFKVYGITVDPRHLTLIADFMTFDGTYQALNRAGMDNCPSTVQQMSFETTLRYLKNAAVRKLKDNLQSPSSSVFIGQESKIGSGLIRLFCK